MLPANWTTLRYHAKQAEAWRTTKRFVSLACGRGSGKTEIARRRVVRMMPVKKPWSDPLYFYALPTYAQAKRVAWGPIKSLFPPEWIKGDPHESNLSVETVFGSTLYVVGMDKPQRIEGTQWDGGVIDESCDQKPGAFARSVVPALEHRDGWCWRIGVPKRYGSGAPEFKEFFDRGVEGDPNYDEDTLSLSWPSSDILTPKQLRWARENLDARDYAEQYGASWQDIGGAVFHAFSEVHNVTAEVSYRPDRELCVGSDFNVDPMCWVLFQRTDQGIDVFDEIHMRNTNTPATLDELHRRHGTHENGWAFFGDASGRARKTSATRSDYLIIKGDERFKGAKLFYSASNPPVADRFAATNRLFCSASGERNLRIHPRCSNLIKDIKYRTYKEYSTEPDDHGELGHFTDALGYPVYKLHPLRVVPHSKPKISTR